MENCQSATSVNSILLLKERIIKVETLLEKYASLTRKFNDLEKSLSQTAENERTAKKDVAKYLEKYCKQTKKCTALLSKVKSLEEIVKDKTNVVEEHQNQVTKLDSVLKIYKLERKNYGELKRDKDFLLSLAWKLFKDSRLESKENKNRKNAEIFFTRFENDLRALKLNDFRKQKLKKIHSQSEELEPSSCVELPAVNSIKSDFNDTNVASESEKSISSEIDNLGGKIEGDKEKPNEEGVFRGQENGIASPVEADKNYQSGIGSLFDPLSSEICVDISTKEFSVDVHSSRNNIISNCDVSMVDGNSCTANIVHSDGTAKRQEQCDVVKVSKEIEMQKNEEYDEFSHKFSASGDKSNLKGSETENYSLSDFRELHNPLQAPREAQESKTVSNDRCIPSNQYGRKTASKRALEPDGDSFGIKEAINNKCLKNSIDIINHDFHHTKKSLNNLSFNLSVGNSAVTDGQRSNTEETALLISGKNDMESCRTDKERTNSQERKPEEVCPFPSLVFASANDEPRKNVYPESEQTSLAFKEDEKKKEEVLKKDSPLEGCEMGEHVLNSNSILNIKMKAVTADMETLRKSPYAESPKEIPDEEIFNILKNFKKVRLISPLKELICKKDTKQDRTLVKSHWKLRPQRCLKNNKFNGNLETKFKINVEKVQISNNTTLHSGDGSSEKSAMVNKSTQTHVEENIEVKEANRKTAEENSKPDKAPTVSVTKDLVRGVFRKIWNGKLKNKFKTLDALTKMLQTHPCCFMFLKNALQYFGDGNMNREKSDTQLVCNFLRNTCINSKYKSKIRTRKKKLSSWHVEDATVSDTRKSQYFFGGNEEDSFKPETAIYNNITKTLNNLYESPGRDRLMQTQHSDWFSTGKSDGLAQRNVFGNSFRTCLSNSTLRDINLHDFKKENETFRCSAVDNYNCSETYFGGYYSMLDIKDIHDAPKPIIEYDNVMPPKSGSAEKAGVFNASTNSCGSEEKSVEVQKSVVVPRRSSRIQDRNSRLKVLDSSPKCVSDSSSSPVPRIDGCEAIVSRSSASNSALPAGCIQSENSTTIGPSLKASESLENKYELLFGETASVEHKENTSDSETPPVNVTFSPKITYNLRHKTINNSTTDNDGCKAGGKDIASRLLVPRLSKKAAKSLESDYYSSEEEDKESETVAEEPSEPLDSTNLLDSIMTAMSKQTEEFKPKVSLSKPVIAELNGAVQNVISTPQHCSFPSPVRQGVCSPPRNYYNNCNEGGDFVNFIRDEESWKFERGSLNESDNENVEESNFPPRKCLEGSKMKKLVEKEIRKFLNVEISSVEDGEEKLKPCIAVLEKASEDIIASVIVAEVMANVDEDLQVFDRPAPPLTQTQHRLMIILTMLTKSCEQLSKINYKILNTIWKKLFPENFFWPDDSVEMASRFYSALCKKISYFKGIWRFCFKAVSSMRQRWCIPIFVVFQVWPDILHNANEIQDNILVNTFVNVILHSPKSEALRRKRQEGKLLAIKHLLINFYNFHINVTIEQLTQQLFKSLWSNTPGSVDALIFVSRCRQWTWIKKNIIPPLIETLTNWSNGTVTDECGVKTLDIIQQISSVLPVEDNPTPPSAKNIISALYQLLSSSGSNLNKEQKIVRTLCSLGHHTGVKEVLCALSNKFPSQDSIHVEIKNAISSSCRKRKLFIENSKNMIKMEVKFKKKKQEMKKKRKKVQKKKKVKKGTVGKSELEIPTA